jgi:hypothetical protein
MKRLFLIICLCIGCEISLQAQVDSSGKKPINWTKELREVTIRDVRKPDTLIQSPTWMIRDFHFRGDSLVLLTWEKNPDKCTIRLFDRTGKELASHKLADKPLGFNKDVYDKLYLECKSATYRLDFYSGAIYLQAMEEKFYYSAIRPTVAANNELFFVSSFHPKRPDFVFLRTERISRETDTLLEIRDSHLYDLYYSEYKFLPFKTQCAIKRLSRETGQSKYDLAAQFSGFTQSLWWRTLYSPLIHADSAIYVFDHYRDSVFCFTQDGALDLKLEMKFHKDKTYKKQLIQDEVTKELYALHMHGGTYTLAPVSYVDASEGNEIPLFYRYVEHIRIRNNEVFYLYRPFESSQNSFLYTEQLPLRQLAGR